jgi:hypothetical protein
MTLLLRPPFCIAGARISSAPTRRKAERVKARAVWEGRGPSQFELGEEPMLSIDDRLGDLLYDQERMLQHEIEDLTPV